MNLKDRVVLITGGAVRVGRTITKELVAAGAIIYCHYNNSHEAAAKLRDSIQGGNEKIRLIRGDLNRTAFAADMIDTIVSQAGQLDVLINNAAIFFRTPLGTVTEEDWDRLFQLNLKSPFFCSQHAGMHMKKKGGGKIISIGDPSGLNPWPGFIPYGLTKSGIISMTKGLAKALAPEVQVNCINPGPVMFPDHYDDEDRDRALRKTLLKREGSPDDIAKTVRFVLEGSDYITGAIINVDGGRSIA
jgi:NAD(P)-dependent dehydrogenase (short-subunit alcohol dehydrogenase family)